MNTLFNVAPVYPNGFAYFEDFITADEESALMKIVSQIELQSFIFQGYEARRKVASFGYDYSFTNGVLKKGKEIPAAFYPLLLKAGDKLLVKPEEFKELLITQYPIGSVINWHRDAPPFDIIAGISLLADCTFKFRPYNKELQNRSNTISLQVKQRSLYVIKDEARTQWQHSIAAVKQARYSITLRTLKNKAPV